MRAIIYLDVKFMSLQRGCTLHVMHNSCYTIFFLCTTLKNVLKDYKVLREEQRRKLVMATYYFVRCVLSVLGSACKLSLAVHGINAQQATHRVLCPPRCVRSWSHGTIILVSLLRWWTIICRYYVRSGVTLGCDVNDLMLTIVYNLYYSGKEFDPCKHTNVSDESKPPCLYQGPPIERDFKYLLSSSWKMWYQYLRFPRTRSESW